MLNLRERLVACLVAPNNRDYRNGNLCVQLSMALKVENKRGGDPGSEVELGNRPACLIPELGPISGDFVVS